MNPNWVGFAGSVGFLMTQEFWEAVISSFLGGVLAGVAIAFGVYRFVTRRFEILKPLAEKRAEQRVVCSIISRELDQFRYSADTLFPNGRFSEGRIEPHAWEALKGSQALHSLPVKLLEPILNAYSGIYFVNRLLDRMELAEMIDWSSPSGSGAAQYVKNKKDEVLRVAPEAEKDCKKTVDGLEAHLKGLQKR